MSGWTSVYRTVTNPRGVQSHQQLLGQKTRKDKFGFHFFFHFLRFLGHWQVVDLWNPGFIPIYNNKHRLYDQSDLSQRQWTNTQYLTGTHSQFTQVVRNHGSCPVILKQLPLMIKIWRNWSGNVHRCGNVITFYWCHSSHSLTCPQCPQFLFLLQGKTRNQMQHTGRTLHKKINTIKTRNKTHCLGLKYFFKSRIINNAKNNAHFVPMDTNHID